MSFLSIFRKLLQRTLEATADAYGVSYSQTEPHETRIGRIYATNDPVFRKIAFHAN